MKIKSEASVPPPTEHFEPFASIEPLTPDVLAMIARTLGPIQFMILKIGDADLNSGAAVIDANTKCLWTKDGRRITINFKYGCLVASVSRGVDPGKPSPVPALEGNTP